MPHDPTANAAHKQRRRRRLERQLRALRAMRDHASTKEIVCAILTIPALALLLFAAAYKLHLWSGSGLIGAAGALLAGAAIWWIGRRFLLLALLIVYALLVIVFEDAPDIYWDSGDTNPADLRRRKLEHAIAKREAMLRDLDGKTP